MNYCDSSLACILCLELIPKVGNQATEREREREREGGEREREKRKKK